MASVFEAGTTNEIRIWVVLLPSAWISLRRCPLGWYRDIPCQQSVLSSRIHCGAGLANPNRQINRSSGVRGGLQGVEEVGADMGPADEERAADGVEGGAAVVSFDDRFCGVEGEGDEAAEDQEVLCGSDLLSASAGEGELAGGDK